MNIFQILLQAPVDPNDSFTILGIGGLIKLLIGFIIIYQIIRYASGKDKIIKNQEETIRLLKKIAGEPEETEIHNDEESN